MEKFIFKKQKILKSLVKLKNQENSFELTFNFQKNEPPLELKFICKNTNKKKLKNCKAIISKKQK